MKVWPLFLSLSALCLCHLWVAWSLWQCFNSYGLQSFWLFMWSLYSTLTIRVKAVKFYQMMGTIRFYIGKQNEGFQIIFLSKCTCSCHIYIMVEHADWFIEFFYVGLELKASSFDWTAAHRDFISGAGLCINFLICLLIFVEYGRHTDIIV